jgi:hypothetical protein
MVAAVATRYVSIDEYLVYLRQKWESLDLVFSQWAAMDNIGQEVFQLEWSGITESRLNELRQSVDQMTPAQTRRYDELLALVTEKRPALEKMFAS